MLEHLFPVLYFAVFIGIAAVAAPRASHKNRKNALHRDFETSEFQTPAGRLSGRDLRVIRFVCEYSGGRNQSTPRRTGWWYCEGPDRRWLLVIGQDMAVSLTRWELHWVVRELSEERMRGALAGDKAALQAAFNGSLPDSGDGKG